MKRITILTIALLAVMVVASWPVEAHARKSKSRPLPRVPANIMTKNVTPPACVQMPYNYIEFPNTRNSQWATFYVKLLYMMADRRGNVNILHIGGSHVQAGVLSNQLRTNFDSMIPGLPGGRTILFPYKVLGTNAPADYKVSTTGVWTKSRCVDRKISLDLGLSGVAAKTSTPGAKLTFTLNNRWQADQLRVLGTPSGSGVEPCVVIGNDTVDCRRDGKPGFVIDLPKAMGTFTVAFRGLGKGSFSLRGVVALSKKPGVNYWAAGVNGASTHSWLRCTLFEEEMKVVGPDLVIFGIGINDAATTNFKPEQFKSNYRAIIKKVRAANPDCAVLFVTNNDCHLSLSSSKMNPNTGDVAKAMEDLAREYHGAVWDVYQLMGGYGSSDKWVAAGLMQKDHVHFTRNGYQLLGDLLYNAIIDNLKATRGTK